jgi:ribonuclease inhibitor
MYSNDGLLSFSRRIVTGPRPLLELGSRTMKFEVDGEKVLTEQAFHQNLAVALSVQAFYGFNLDALWDLLSSRVERPVTLIWKNSQISKNAMGTSFEKILEILERVRQQDEKFGWEDKFTYELR